MTLAAESPLGRLSAWALLLAVVGLGYLLLLRPYLASHAELDSALERAQTLAQGYRKVAAEVPGLEGTIAKLDARQARSRIFLTGGTDALAAAQLQQAVNGLVTRSQAQLRSVQILPTEAEGDFLRVTLRVQMNARTEALQDILYALESQRPLLFISLIEVRGRRGRINNQSSTEDPLLQVTLDIVGYLPPEVS